ncbi:endolytic transglycosylase MltG [Salimicrobium halophilum]|uniref:YceG-like family protein n=1 Tax=Salimicrobium halophilum TaxID=86666 RepID=A0A1G8PRY4_9BACI|nr:endolytic transglycosylase MltG [Salimicrobium halophilum]SDI95284.1 hypothetical protein SAMN04490247_0165 [Salimicrobium halophilum]
MRPMLQAFSAGLLLATVIIAISYYYTDSKSEQKAAPAELSTEEMIDRLENDSFVIHTTEEWKKKKQELRSGSGQGEQAETIKSLSLTVSEGMSSKDISRTLENASIIEDGQAFNDYLIQNGLSKQIQTGDFLVNQDMSQPELAEILTSN